MAWTASRFVGYIFMENVIIFMENVLIFTENVLIFDFFDVY